MVLPSRQSVTVDPAPNGRRARVLLCDDSLVIRGAISRMLKGIEDIEIVASVGNGQIAVDTVARHLSTAPIDVVVLDIEMPVMDGLQALPLLLKLDPTIRVVMASTLTLRGADVAMQALRLGAADYVPKPSAAGVFNDDAFRDELIAKVRGLARLRARQGLRARIMPPAKLPAPATRAIGARPTARPRLIAIGSSTGGPQALFTFFNALGCRVGLPVILTQHMPTAFVPLLAQHITRLGGLPCTPAADGELLRPNHVLIAPGDRHLTVEARPPGLTSVLSNGPPENFCRPAVDVMLRSAAISCQGQVLVVMLTGMGRDGLEGTRKIVELGGIALAQDEESSVVWGMPGAIAAAGLCQAVLPLERLAGAVREIVGA